MKNERLPIKFFHKRERDECSTEGLGGGDFPKWMDPTSIKERSLNIRSALTDIYTSLDNKRRYNNNVPSVIKVKLEPNALAKTYRREVGSLFNTDKLNTIGMNGEDEVLVKIDNEEELQKVVEKVSKADDETPSKSLIYGICSIKGLEEFKPLVDKEVNESSILKIKLFNYGDFELDQIVEKEFGLFCKKHELKYKNVPYSGELSIYRIDRITSDALNELKSFDGVQMISAMPIYNITLDQVVESKVIPIKEPEAGVEYPIVGILDTGIANIPHLKEWTINRDITYYSQEDIDKGHGTFVAGVLLYGDDLENAEYTGLHGCKLLEAIVMPNLNRQQITEDELIHQVWDTISRNNDVKIWNLSLGTDQEADLYEFSDFAKALDEIQDHNDVLICKSAGNCYNFKNNSPVSRIAKSADTVRGLVVGSIAHNKNSTDIADKNTPSPFSRIGRGPAQIIKPDVVHYGGNAGLSSNNEIVFNPVKSFSTNGNIVGHVGTSFSTPRVAAIASGLNNMLSGPFDPILLKGLIIHSAKYPKEMELPITEKVNQVGFGIPSNINDILFNNPDEITLILRDRLVKGHYIDILDFPFPKSMIDEDGYFYGELTVTLVTSPILESSQGVEYCQSNIDIRIGSYDNKSRRDLEKPHVKNPIKGDGKQNVLAMANYSKKAQGGVNMEFASERLLVSYGNKYQPIKKWRVNLDEFTPTNKNRYLKAPKNWYLEIEGLYRNYTEEKANRANSTPSQSFCLIITIRDTKRRGTIYNEVTHLLDSFNFIHQNIEVREEVRVRQHE